MRKNLLFKLVPLLLLISSMVWAQERAITGRVTSVEDGSALPGVNVVVKGTTNGTVTDAEGKFSLSVPSSGGVLAFSFIGMATEEISLDGRTTVDLQMKADIQQLSEVVVTAVGIQRERKALGYSVEAVNPNKLQQVSEPDPIRALSGKVAGVNIIGSSGLAGSATRITIRGNNSLLGNNQPLFVVDGVPFNNDVLTTSNQLVGGGAYGGGINGLDPNNIASMTVLKGGAAAALYGSRASNGVILITTKTGSSKTSNKGLEITYNSSFSIEQIANIPDYQNKYGTGTKFAYGEVNGSWGAAFNNAAGYPSQTTIPLWAPIAGAYPNAPKTVPYQAYPNNVKDFFRDGKVVENSVSFNGGNTKSNFTATVSRLDQSSFVPGSSFERTNLSIGANTILENKLSVGASFAYINTVQAGPPGGSNSNSVFARTLYLGRSWDLQGQPYEDPVDKSSIFFVANTQATNPYWVSKYDGFNQKNNRILANLNFGYDITSWLNASYKIGINTSSQKNQEWNRPGTAVQGGLGNFTDDYLTFTEIESNLILSSNFDLTEDLNLRALLGHNINQRTSDRQSYFGSEFIDFNILDIDNTKTQLTNGGIYTRRRIVGVYLDATLSYKDIAFLNLTARRDQSSTLPKANNAYYYPAASASVVFTDALNLKSKVLNYGKLRMGFSRVGKDADPYLLNYVYNINPTGNNFTFPFNKVSGLTYGDQAVNPRLTPEFTNEFEIGTELQFFNNRIAVDVAVYDKRTTNQIAAQAVPTVSGFRNYLTNFGEVSNRGIEIGAMVKPLQLSNGFSWTVNGVFTHNINKIEALAPGVDEIVVRNLFGGSITPVHRPGSQYAVWRGSVNARDDEGNLLINPANGQMIRSTKQAIIGNPNPAYKAGLTNSFAYKGVSLSVLVDYTHGGNIFSQTTAQMLGRGVTTDTQNREVNAVIPGVLGDPNTGEPLRDEAGNKIRNTIQIEVNDLYFGETFGTNSANEWNVFDASVFRVREVGLSYQLPKSILGKTPFTSLSIGLTGRNLWYYAPGFPKGINFDPETSTLGASNAQGFDYQNSPSVKRYGINLKVTF